MSFTKRKSIQNKTKKRNVEKKRQANHEEIISGEKKYQSKFNIDNMKFSEEYMKVSMEQAIALRNDVISYIKSNPDYSNIPDNEKVQIFCKDKKHSEFQKEFPIVTRYLICMGQFHPKAFKKYLDKCKNFKYKSAEEREKGYVEDQWIRRQADYVRYLWEEYTTHYKTSDAQGIWRHAYETLKKEFSDFKQLHKETEEKIKKENKVNKKELVKELLGRLSRNEQQLANEESKKLLAKLQAQLQVQRRTKLMHQIKNNVPTLH